MTNLATVKNHLNVLFPKVLLFYNLIDRYLAHTNRNITCIAINEFIKNKSSKTSPGYY